MPEVEKVTEERRKASFALFSPPTEGCMHRGEGYLADGHIHMANVHEIREPHHQWVCRGGKPAFLRRLSIFADLPLKPSCLAVSVF